MTAGRGERGGEGKENGLGRRGGGGGGRAGGGGGGRGGGRGKLFDGWDRVQVLGEGGSSDGEAIAMEEA
jgi:hypothetical protein